MSLFVTRLISYRGTDRKVLNPFCLADKAWAITVGSWKQLESDLQERERKLWRDKGNNRSPEAAHGCVDEPIREPRLLAKPNGDGVGRQYPFHRERK